MPPVAVAVDFNTEALKSMQKEGHQIAAEALGSRSFKTGKNFCLDYAGKVVMVRKCKKTGTKQSWRLDDSGRLLASDGRCVAGQYLAKCNQGKNQKWKLDDKNRLSNGGRCLQTQSNPARNGAKVVPAPCNNAANQVWH